MLYTSELTGKSYKTVEELEKVEAAVKNTISEKQKQKEARQADANEVQAAAKKYLSLYKEHEVIRKAQREEEDKAYKNYKQKINAFAEKHNGYHLTYKQDGDNIEFKIEENYPKAMQDAFDDTKVFMSRLFNIFGI